MTNDQCYLGIPNIFEQELHFFFFFLSKNKFITFILISTWWMSTWFLYQFICLLFVRASLFNCFFLKKKLACIPSLEPPLIVLTSKPQLLFIISCYHFISTLREWFLSISFYFSIEHYHFILSFMGTFAAKLTSIPLNYLGDSYLICQHIGNS